MDKRILLSIVVVMVVGMFGSAAFAGGPLGPPKASAGTSQWVVGVEYAREQVDLKSYGKIFDGTLSWESVFEIEDIRSNMFFASLSMGLADNWDVFVRLGAADAKDDMERPYEALAGGESYGFGGSSGFAWGVGTRGTLSESGSWTFGGVAQLTWIDPGGDEVSWQDPASPTDVYSGDVELDWRQFQAGIGVTYDVDGWSVYGGPCWFFVNGDLDFDLTWYSGGVPQGVDDYTHDVRQEEDFGGWVGLQCDLGNNSTCYAECQFVSEGWTFAIGWSMPLPFR